MSQKSSVPQAISFVSRVLKRDTRKHHKRRSALCSMASAEKRHPMTVLVMAAFFWIPGMPLSLAAVSIGIFGV
jgi:hypothetical protein